MVIIFFLIGSAASKVDLKPGDQLVTMDTISLAGLDHAEIIKMIQKVIVGTCGLTVIMYCSCRLQ